MVSGEWWIAFFPGARADGRGVLLQPARRRPARHRRSAAADVSARAMTAPPLLDVRDLTVEFSTRRGIVKAVQHVNISVAKGETLGIVGESGSGKSVTSYAVMRILDRAGRIAEGSVMFSGIDVKAAERRPDARSARPRNLDDLPEPARGAQSDPQSRRPDRGRAAPACRRRGSATVDARRRSSRWSRSDRPAARALSRLSVRAVGRHVPARRDRAGAGLQSAAADRRRADHRPRRHHAEGGDGPDRRADAAARHVDHPDHARSRPGRRLLRPRGGDGEGPRGRDRAVGGISSPRPRTPTPES